MTPILATFISIDATDTTQILGYTKDLTTDLGPLLLIIVSVGVGIMIFWAIVGSIKH
jgi:hypothetical protein